MFSGAPTALLETDVYGKKPGTMRRCCTITAPNAAVEGTIFKEAW
jgi:hypothetical protein